MRVVTADGAIDLDGVSGSLAARLAAMPAVASSVVAGSRALAPLLAHGILGDEDLPLRIVPADPASLDGWRFA